MLFNRSPSVFIFLSVYSCQKRLCVSKQDTHIQPGHSVPPPEASQLEMEFYWSLLKRLCHVGAVLPHSFQ